MVWGIYFEIEKKQEKYLKNILLCLNHPKKYFVIKQRFIIVAKSVFENVEQCKRPDIKIF